MRTLYIDAGWTSIGYCVYDSGVRQDSGELHYSQKDKIARLKAISLDLRKLIKAEAIERVVCEDFKVFGCKGTRAQNVLLMIGSFIETCNSYDIRIELVNFNHWKAMWKKIDNKPYFDDMREHQKDAAMMGFTLEHSVVEVPDEF